MGCFTSLNLESLQLCTEGLGFESSDDVEGRENERKDYDWRDHKKVDPVEHSLVNLDIKLTNSADVDETSSGFKRSMVVKNFPPPISSIGRTGRPGFIFQSYRHDGRFVLREFKIPHTEIFHASRENGRLKLHLVPQAEDQEEDDDDGEEKGDAIDEEQQEQDQDQDQEVGSESTPEICNG